MLGGSISTTHGKGEFPNYGTEVDNRPFSELAHTGQTRLGNPDQGEKIHVKNAPHGLHWNILKGPTDTVACVVDE